MTEESAAEKATPRRGRPRRRRTLSETMEAGTAQEELEKAGTVISKLTKQKATLEKQVVKGTNKLAEAKRDLSELRVTFATERTELKEQVETILVEASTLRDEKDILITKLSRVETLSHLTELIDEYRRVKSQQMDIYVGVEDIGVFRWTDCLSDRKREITVTHRPRQTAEFISFLEHVIEAARAGMALHERERELYEALTDTDLPGIERVMNFPLPGEPGPDAE